MTPPGIIASRIQGKPIFWRNCTRDRKVLIHSTADKKIKKFIDKKTEIDHTQRAARSEGRSPRAILSSTFSDELLLATNNQAKVFAVSVKDRSAYH